MTILNGIYFSIAFCQLFMQTVRFRQFSKCSFSETCYKSVILFQPSETSRHINLMFNPKKQQLNQTKMEKPACIQGKMAKIDLLARSIFNQIFFCLIFPHEAWNLFSLWPECMYCNTIINDLTPLTFCVNLKQKLDHWLNVMFNSLKLTFTVLWLFMAYFISVFQNINDHQVCYTFHFMLVHWN